MIIYLGNAFSDKKLMDVCAGLDYPHLLVSFLDKTQFERRVYPERAPEPKPKAKRKKK